MWEYQNTDELYHFGILGMKWGHRKARKKENYRKKASKIYNKNMTSAKFALSGDEARINFMKKTPLQKAGSMLATNIVKETINTIFEGGLKSGDAGHKQLRNKGIKVMSNSLLDTVAYNAISKSTMKRFNDDGTYKHNKKSGIMNKENMMTIGHEMIKTLGPALLKVGGIAVGANNYVKYKTQQNYESWGPNILSSKSGKSNPFDTIELNKKNGIWR